MKRKYALVTGASQGLGRAFAWELARRKFNLILTALPGEGLPGLAEQLSLSGVAVQFREIDLTDEKALGQFVEWAGGQFELEMLVNNAGRGGTRPFANAEPGYLEGILRLNIHTTVRLTHQLLPNLMRQRRAYILNVSSMAAFSPIGFKTVYPASKSFVLQFSRGLHEELKGTGLTVSVVCPGPMKTNQDATERIEKQGFKGRLGLLSPEKVAVLAIEGALKGRPVIVPGLANQVNRLLMALLPGWLKVRLLTKAIRQEV